MKNKGLEEVYIFFVVIIKFVIISSVFWHSICSLLKLFEGRAPSIFAKQPLIINCKSFGDYADFVPIHWQFDIERSQGSLQLLQKFHKYFLGRIREIPNQYCEQEH